MAIYRSWDMNNVETIKIKIESNWLRSGYFVYVAEIVYDKLKYLYIGQTGDNNYHTARAPFYRISGHFSKGVSTENQIIKYFKTKILCDVNVSKEYLEKALIDSEISYTFWKICDFYFNIDGNEFQHQISTCKAQMVEQWLIYNLQNKKGITVLNDSVVNIITASKKKSLGKEINNLIPLCEQILKDLRYE